MTFALSTPLSIARKGKFPANGGLTAWAFFRTGKSWFTTPSWTALSSRRSPMTIVQTIMAPQPRFAQFDFRDVPAGKGDGEMRFHRDRPYQPTTEIEPERPYECTYVCAIHYLSDVGASDPCFCVVPNSGPYETFGGGPRPIGAGCL